MTDDSADAVRAIRPTASAVAVELASGARHVVSRAQLLDLRLAPGDRLTPSELDTVEAAAATYTVERRLLGLLARRPRSRAEIERRLEGWGVTSGTADEVLARLGRAGLLDDARMARETASGLQRRGHGALRVGHDLRRLGVDDETTAEVERNHAAADPSTAAALLERRFGPRPYDESTTRRAAALLERRGFDGELVASLLDLDL